MRKRMICAKRCPTFRHPRVLQADRKAVGDTQPAFDLAQRQQTAFRRQPTAVKTGDNRLCLGSVTDREETALHQPWRVQLRLIRGFRLSTQTPTPNQYL